LLEKSVRWLEYLMGILAGDAMTTAKEYREFAKECLKWADEAEADNDRNSFLEMARDWTLAAMRLEGGLTPEERETKKPPGTLVSPDGR
jgi:hypothetical protein